MSNYAIYQPQGKAGEYAVWACNSHIGCPNNCSYCYCKKGLLASSMGSSTATLKKCFRNHKHFLEVFESELSFNIVQLQKHGLFFSFTTDPMLPELYSDTMEAVILSISYGVPVKILTKCAGWVTDEKLEILRLVGRHFENFDRMIAFGFTLTGHDELEPGASTNADRIQAMKKLHDAGYRTFASIEPIIDIESSYRMVEATHQFCDLFKIGPESGKKYTKNDVRELYAKVNILICCRSKAKVYWKDGFLKLLSISRDNCLTSFHCTVGRDYSLFDFDLNCK